MAAGHLFDRLSLAFNPADRTATLTVLGAQPAHTLVLEASQDLLNWTPLATNAPATTTNWLFLDTNAPVFQQRFYRAVGQGK